MSDEEGSMIIIEFKQSVNLVRFIGNGLIPTKLNIKAEIIPTEETEDSDFDVAFTKIKFWFDTIVNHAVAYCIGNEMAFNMMIKDGHPQLANHLIITPNEPSDEHLAALFQSKMQALSSNKFTFGQIKIESKSFNGLVFTYIGSWEDDLPEMKDWFSTTPYYFETPWWTRDDISTIDMIIGEYDAENTPMWATKLDFIEQTILSENPSTQNIVKGTFKPKIIDGEKPLE